MQHELPLSQHEMSDDLGILRLGRYVEHEKFCLHQFRDAFVEYDVPRKDASTDRAKMMPRGCRLNRGGKSHVPEPVIGWLRDGRVVDDVLPDLLWRRMDHDDVGH